MVKLKKKKQLCGKIYIDKDGNTGATCANPLPCNLDHLIVEKEPVCSHDFRYSHTEYPPMGTYTAIPPNKEVVLCPKCGELRKSIVM